MERETANLITKSRQGAVPYETQPGEQQQRVIDCVLARPFEPLETARIAIPVLETRR